MRTPVSLWRPSPRPYQEQPQPWQYPAGYQALPLNEKGELKWEGWRWTVSRALKNQVVGVDATGGKALVYYCNTPVVELDLTAGSAVPLPVDPFRSLDCRAAEGCLPLPTATQTPQLPPIPEQSTGAPPLRPRELTQLGRNDSVQKRDG